jgi:hypothetical protein
MPIKNAAAVVDPGNCARFHDNVLGNLGKRVKIILVKSDEIVKSGDANLILFIQFLGIGLSRLHEPRHRIYNLFAPLLAGHWVSPLERK